MVSSPPSESCNIIDRDGWLVSARKVPSPNFSSRPEGAVIELLVVHNISLPPGEFGGGYIEDFFCNQLEANAHPYFAEICDLKVSAHCLIKRSGSVVQFVSFNERAWHAGRSCFRGREECNDFSVGIELEGTDLEPYTKEQYEALASITQALEAHYPSFDKTSIAGHCDIAPGRKTDPGPAFDWAYFRRRLDNIHQ